MIFIIIVNTMFYFTFLYPFTYSFYIALRVLYLALYAENALVVYKRKQDDSIEEIRVCSLYFTVK